LKRGAPNHHSSYGSKDLREISEYIALDDPESAYRLRRQLIEQVKTLKDFPQLGRIVPEFKITAIRELIRNPYRIIYLLKEEGRVIEILRFWHAARGRPKI
jgi:plasmid stabilization system protein ParE